MKYAKVEMDVYDDIHVKRGIDKPSNVNCYLTILSSTLDWYIIVKNNYDEIDEAIKQLKEQRISTYKHRIRCIEL